MQKRRKKTAQLTLHRPDQIMFTYGLATVCFYTTAEA